MKHRKDSGRDLRSFFVVNMMLVTLAMILLSGILAYLLSRGIALKGISKEDATKIFFFWIIISTSGAFCFLYSKVKYVVNCIETIDKATKKVAKGEFDVRINLQDGVKIHEMKNLFDSFNRMVSDLGMIETLRDNFIADVSHEIKTPIAAIDGYATLLQDDTLESAERQKYLESILYNSKRLTNLTGNILMISKLDNGTIRPEEKEFRLDEQIRRIFLTFEEEWTRKNLELDIDLEEVKYFGDEDLLYHVWLNLMSNAIKFSKEGGSLRLRLKQNKVEALAEIQDSGIGMNEETKKHLFDKFYQGDKSRASEGNGLGLTLVKTIAEICSLRIDVESEPGKGTKMLVHLPLRNE